MKKSLVDFWKKFLHKKDIGRPLISPELDIALLKSVRKQPYTKITQIRHFKRFLSRGEKMIYRMCVLALSFGLLLLSYNFINNHTTKVPDQGGDYVEGIVGSPALINPLFASLNEVDKDIVRLVYSGLMKIDEQGNLVPDLSENFSLSEDKKTYTFHLRKNVVWHDDEPFTSKDVVFTFETIQNRAVNSPLLLSFQGVKVLAPDDYTVQFVLPEVYTPFPSSLTVGILPEHIWSQIPVEQIRLARTNLQAIGTGPFKFGRLVSDRTGFISEYTLDRFERYYQRAAYLEHFTFRFFASYDGNDSASASIAALREQNVDGVNFVPVSLKEKVDRRHLVMYTPALPQYTALFFNQKRQIQLAEKDVRIALEEAIDKQKIIKDTQKGDASLIFGPILEGYPGYVIPSTTLVYSLDNANAKLDKFFERVNAEDLKAQRKLNLEKDWMAVNSSTTSTLNEGGTMEEFVNNTLTEEFGTAQTFFRRPKKGEIVTLNLVTVDTPEYRRTAEIIVGFWQEIGIKTNVEFVNPRVLSRDVLKDRKYDVLLYGVLLGSDPDQYPFWHSSQAAYPGLNLSQYVNRSADELLQKARETEKPEEIASFYRQFEEKVLQDVPAIFLYSPKYHYALSDTIKGILLPRITEPSDRLSGASNWYIDTDLHWGKE